MAESLLYVRIIDDHFIDGRSVGSTKLPAYSLFRLPEWRGHAELLPAPAEWCLEQFGYIPSGIIAEIDWVEMCFKTDIDMMMFKLRWL